jgi:hypothetical protein
MKKVGVFMAGMTALLLSLSLGLSGCGDGTSDGGDGGDYGAMGNYDPVVTITGLPPGSYNVYASHSYDSGYSSYNAAFQAFNASGPVFYLISVGGNSMYQSQAYYTVILTKSDGTLIGYKTVLFANGTVTLAYSDISSSGLVADIDQSLAGVWKDNMDNGNVLTITITSNSITWSGTVGTSINNAVNNYNQYGTWVWIVKNGKFTIKYTVSGQSMSADVYSYIINGSNMELKDVGGSVTIATLIKE